MGVQDRRLERLKLTADQRRRIGAEQRKLARQVEAVRGRAWAARESFFVLLASPAPDPNALREAQAQVGSEQQEMRRLVFEHLLRIRQVLDQQQRRELRRLLRSPGGRHGRQMRRGRRAPPEDVPGGPEASTELAPRSI